MEKYFFVRTGRQYSRVCLDEFIYAESAGNYVRIFTDSGSYLVLFSLKQLEKVLPVQSFCRVTRGYLVSVNRVISFDKESVTLKGNKRLPCTDLYRKELERRVTILLNDEIITNERSLELAKNLN